MARIEPQRADWVRASLLSGFIATFAMTSMLTIGYGVANSLADANGNLLQRWSYGLSENQLTANISDRFLFVMMANLVCGLIWALVYARIIGPTLNHAGWRSGLLFSLVPWLLSVTIFFPIAGAGFLGSDLDAGPLPVLGNLIVHAVFGLVLGSMYSIDIEMDLDGTSGDRYAALSAERGATIGLAIGGLIGGVGGWLMADQLSNLAGQPVIALAGALSGGAVGTLLGSFAGMSEEIHESTERRSPATVAREPMR